MNKINYYEPITLSKQFLENINNKVEQNLNEDKVNIYDNSHINPPFRYYSDDINLNLTSKIIPDFTYKTKSIFPAEKPIQTEHDEIGINTGILRALSGYTDYGNFKVANQSLPDSWKHKETPKNFLFDLE